MPCRFQQVCPTTIPPLPASITPIDLYPLSEQQLCGIFYFCLPHRHSPIQKNAECSSSRQIQIQVSWLILVQFHRWHWRIWEEFVCETVRSMAATEQIRIWHTPSPSFLGGFAAVCGACRDPCLDKLGRVGSYYWPDIKPNTLKTDLFVGI